MRCGLYGKLPSKRDFIAHVDDLYDGNPGERIAKRFVHPRFDCVNELQRVGAAETLLRDDRLGRRLTRKKERGNAGRHSFRDITDQRTRNWTWSAGHSRHQSDGRRAAFDGERGFGLGCDAADFNLRRDGEHIRVVGGYSVQ